MTCLAALRTFLVDVLDPGRTAEVARLRWQLDNLAERLRAAEVDADWARTAASPEWLKRRVEVAEEMADRFREQRDMARDALAGMMEERGW